MTHCVEPGVWIERRTGRDFAGRGALFLDRDGVINVDHGYVGRPEDVALLPVTARLIALANAAGAAVVVVTNQSGIGRGYFGWPDFAMTMDAIHQGLRAEGATVDMVCACACHAEAKGPYRAADHPMRKPRAGMIRAALSMLGLDPAASLILGDAPSDMVSGRRAGLAGGAYAGPGAAPAEPGFPVAHYAFGPDDDQLVADYASFLEGRPSPWTQSFAGGGD